ncbi:MAG: hypothetical protein QOJ39_3725 [Candidatus Eremiobacteraeota bacterium]|jgi:predicted trehalose synthase|nr:hypothetical protein [Candidatus Eremiobacteraeota bacterium]
MSYGASGSGSGKVQALYGVWVHGQIKGILDQANKRKSEIPAEQSADVQEALKALEQALQKLAHHAK